MAGPGFPRALPRLLFLLLLPAGCGGFFPNIWSLVAAPGSVSHQDLTEEAALNVTLQLFLDRPRPGVPPVAAEDFQGRTLLADELFAAYFGAGAPSRRFRAAVAEVSRANAAQDFLAATRLDPVLHFDAERLGPGRTRLLRTLEEVLGAARALAFPLARRRLGALLHALQDFYSHSNWVELGEDGAHPDLLRTRPDLRNLARAGDETCSDCAGLSCPGNLLGSGLLTSGYFGVDPPKPPGKCSHGGQFDQSSSQHPRGGINKDSSSWLFSPHHALHPAAARLAQEASIQALTLLRARLGDGDFSRLLDITPATGLTFVLDTTGSMGEEINAAKVQARSIIDQRRGGPLEPSHYILVPFHDPGFGPVFQTSDPDVFWKHLNELDALGGGDEPEMCLSALELALLHTPPLSDIYVFTDASPKDAHLSNRVEALSQERRCRVTFLVTEDPSRWRARARRELLPPERFDPYVALAAASGGEVIFTQDQHIRDVAGSVVGDGAADVVTLLQVRTLGGPGTPGTPLSFWVDRLVTEVVIRVYGELSGFCLRDPTGVRQTEAEGPGPLARTRRSGQFWAAALLDPPRPGAWGLEVTATGNYSVRVQARTSLDFLFYFGAPVEGGPHPGLYPLSQPVTGLPAVLLVEVAGAKAGPGAPKLSHAVLRGPGGAELGRVALSPAGSPRRDLLSGPLPPTLPAHEPFSLELVGRDGGGQALRRVAPQPLFVAPVLVELSRAGPPGPGPAARLLLCVSSFSGPRELLLTAAADRGFAVRSNLSRVRLGQNETAWGELSLQPPSSVAPDSVVTVTVSVGAGPSPPVHAFLQLLVQPPERDASRGHTSVPEAAASPVHGGPPPEPSVGAGLELGTGLSGAGEAAGRGRGGLLGALVLPGVTLGCLGVHYRM
ncbi:von Willebrand factor A domain-containing protein 7 [Tachyglossus aculeatus]|uniref:von Willebrand factor A domain-containing protein 7 n=1 Tax=Tachyglossus aculeatus TaxID=9261 RepID=UPI0018F6B71A|nr:von Willebrand factor A domain-containing protein 7 [Tachyglossus aculeatus]